MKNNPHPGITMHNFPVGAGVAGFVFTVGSMAIFPAFPRCGFFLRSLSRSAWASRLFFV